MIKNPVYLTVKIKGKEEYIGNYYDSNTSLILSISEPEDIETCKKKANIMIEDYFRTNKWKDT